MTASIHRVAEELREGKPVEIELYGIGEGASMRGILKDGQFLTLTPTPPAEISVGDIVFVKWRNQNYLIHLVKEIEEGRFLIASNVGTINGWVDGADILAKITQIRDP